MHFPSSVMVHAPGNRSISDGPRTRVRPLPDADKEGPPGVCFHGAHRADMLDNRGSCCRLPECPGYPCTEPSDTKTYHCTNCQKNIRNCHASNPPCSFMRRTVWPHSLLQVGRVPALTCFLYSAWLRVNRTLSTGQTRRTRRGLSWGPLADVWWDILHPLPFCNQFPCQGNSSGREPDFQPFVVLQQVCTLELSYGVRYVSCGKRFVCLL